MGTQRFRFRRPADRRSSSQRRSTMADVHRRAVNSRQISCGVSPPMDVSAWLRRLELGEYAAAFAANHVDAVTLRQLTADDLREIGVTSVGHRRRLLEAIAKLDESSNEKQKRTAGPDKERRPVTVLFADLCGFTALSRSLPDELLHSLLELLSFRGRRDSRTARRHGR